MWLTASSLRRPVPWVLVIAVVVGFSVFLIGYPLYRDIRRRALAARVYPDVLRAAALCRIADEIYQKTGLLLTSRPALERSAFYPFTSSYEQGCTDGYIDMAYLEGRRSFWTGLKWDEHGTHVLYRQEKPADNPRKQTQRLLNFFLSGVHNISAVVSDIRLRFLKQHQQAVKVSMGTCTLLWDNRPSLPTPHLVGDLPTDKRSLREYVQWLSHSVVGSPLTDGWGSLVILSIDDGCLRAQSGGEDRLLHTSDDIVVTRQIMSR